MNPDFARIKQTTDLVAVVESYGIALIRTGADHVGLCPFHEDTKPSFHVTQAKGLFHCPACGAAGNVIQFVARKEGVSDREAALKLCSAIPGVQRGSELASPASLAPPPVAPLPDPKLLAAAVEHYHEALFGSDKRGLDYLRARGLADLETLRHFKVGFVTGGLKAKLSVAQRGALAALFNERGNERFYLRLVVPVLDADGQAVGLYGRSIQSNPEVKHLYLAGGHRGVWNGAAAAAHADELIVTESILDGIAFFTAGRKNVIAAYGAGGWTPHHEGLIEKHGVRKLVFAYDNDERGEAAARKLASTLGPRGIRCHRLQWPEGVKDACDYFAAHEATGFASLPAVAVGVAAPRLTLVERTDEGALFQNGSVSYRVRELSGNGLRVAVTARNEKAAHVDNIDLYGARSRRGFAATAAERLVVEPRKIEDDLLALLESLEGLQAETDNDTAQTQASDDDGRRA